MTTDLVPFRYEGQVVRTVLIDGEPWFVLADLCTVLGLTRSASAVSERLDDGVRQTHPIEDSMGRTQQATIVNEAGMYEVVIRSDKPEAVTFRRWITGTVLPEIRKTGSFGVVQSPAQQMAIGLVAAQQLLTAADERIAELEPKAEAFDHLMDSIGLYSMEAAAKALGWGRNVLFRDLRRMGILQGNNLPYQRYMHHFEVKTATYTNRKTGELFPTATTYVRPAGLDFLRKRLEHSPTLVGADA